MKYFKFRFLWKILSVIVVLLSFVFFAFQAFHNIQNIPPIKLEASAIIAFIASVCLVVTGVFTSGLIWQLLVRDAGVELPLYQAQVIVGISQFGKYLPGNIGQHIGRVAMAKDYGVSVPISLNTMIVETIWLVAIALGVGTASLYFLELKFTHFLNLKAPELLILSLLLLCSPWIGIAFLNRFFSGLVRKITNGKLIQYPGKKTAAKVILLYILSSLIFGLILKLQAQWIFGITNGNVVQLSGIFALVWVAGFLLPGSSGGLGVRESLMLIMLSPVLGEGATLGISITLRFTTLIGDALSFTIGLLLKAISKTK